MNILPKKSWHVRNKDNVAKVRRDEAKAREEEEDKERRRLLAEQEVRTEALRSRVRTKNPEDEEEIPIEYQGHINFFSDLETGEYDDKKKNAEHEAEVKAEKEKQEKKIGLLTYLGQSLLDSSEKPWHIRSKKERDEIQETKAARSERFKAVLDPLNDIKKFIGETKKALGHGSEKDVKKSMLSRRFGIVDVPALESRKGKKRKHKKEKKSKKSKKHKHQKIEKSVKGPGLDDEDVSSSEGSTDEEEVARQRKLEVLRHQRLVREKEERARAEKFLSEKRNPKPKEKEKIEDDRSRSYNSQFNPHLARQNNTKEKPAW